MSNTQNLTPQQMQQLMMMQQQQQGQQMPEQDNNQDEDMIEFANKVANQLQNEQSGQDSTMQYEQPSPEEIQQMQQQQMMQQMQQQQIMQQMQQEQEKTQQKEPEKAKGLMGKLPTDFKEPLLVAAIFLILSYPAITEQIAKYVPQILEDGKVTTTGLLLLALLAGVLFYISKCFLPK